MSKNQAIGVFDSGMGGISVLKQLVHLMPNESYIYLGDTARVPYGNKSESTIKEYSSECAEFLIENDVKMIVIACNTASSYAFETVKKVAKNIHVVEMIKPACKAAAKETVNGKIGVIGTRGTINSNAYYNELIKYAFDNIKISSEACPLFVPLVEEGYIEHQATEIIAKEYLSNIIANEVDTLVLACTHYPFLLPLLQKIMPKVRFIDTGYQAALVARDILSENNLLSDEDASSIEVYCTDNSPLLSALAEKYLNFAIPEPKKVLL